VTISSSQGVRDSIIERVYNHPELKNCPIDTTFKIIGQKWTVLILREMFRNRTQFNRILENIEGLTPKVFTQRMKALQKLGIVERRLVSESPIRVEYRLTDLGRELEPVLLAAAVFSMNFMSTTVFKDKKSRHFDEFCR
jgi:DNA-binding HxlR family transcriptional regulator